mgnify:CR=1 FL=1
MQAFRHLIDTSSYQRLQVQTLHGATVLLRLHDTLPGSTEIVHLHPHPALSQSHQTSLSTDGTNVGSREIILLVDELLKVNIVTEGHLRSVKREDLLLGVFWELLVNRYKTMHIRITLTVWVLEENLTINTTRADQSRI